MKKIAFALASLAFAGASFAQKSTPAYIELGIGSGHVAEDCTGIPDCKNNHTGFRVVGGYSLGNQLAAELSYLDYGKAEGSSATASATVKVHGYGLGLAYTAPLNDRFSTVLRLGIASNKTHFDATTMNSRNQSKTALQYGIGLAYSLNEQAALTVNFDGSTANDSTGNMSVHLLSAGVKFAF